MCVSYILYTSAVLFREYIRFCSDVYVMMTMDLFRWASLSGRAQLSCHGCKKRHGRVFVCVSSHCRLPRSQYMHRYLSSSTHTFYYIHYYYTIPQNGWLVGCLQRPPTVAFVSSICVKRETRRTKKHERREKDNSVSNEKRNEKRNGRTTEHASHITSRMYSAARCSLVFVGRHDAMFATARFHHSPERFNLPLRMTHAHPF